MSLELQINEGSSTRTKLPSFNELVSDFEHEKSIKSKQIGEIPKNFNKFDSNQRWQQRKGEINSRRPSLKHNEFSGDINIRSRFIFPQPPITNHQTRPPSHNSSRSLGSIDLRGDLHARFANMQSQHHERPSILSNVSTNSTNSDFSQMHHRKRSSLNSIDTMVSIPESTNSTEFLPKQIFITDAEMLHKIERLLIASKMYLEVAKSIENDLIQDLSPDGDGNKLIEINPALWGNRAFIDSDSLNHFLGNIPLQLLIDTTNHTEVISDCLKDWRCYNNKLEVLPALNTLMDKNEPQMRVKKRNLGEQKGDKNSDIKSKETIFISVNQDMLGNISRTQSSLITDRKPTKMKIKKVKPKEQGLNEELSASKKMVCMQCGETDTPEWRRGPYGVRSLCNACGLFHGKLIKKLGVDQATEIMVKRHQNGQGSDRRIPNEDLY